MIKTSIVLLSITGLILAVNPVLAVPPTFVESELTTPGTSRELWLPPAADNAPVISLGEAIDPATGETVNGLAFIHYKKGLGKLGNKNGELTSSTCYTFLGRGAKWRTAENYLFDAANVRRLDPASIRTLLAQGVESWDGEVLANVFGTEATGTVDGVDTSSPDGKNEVLFGDIAKQGAIAVTIVWGNFYGPSSQRKLVEWDMIFDQTDYDWSAEASGVAGKMDFHNIASHEIGHAAGMGHSGSCADETMYAYADYAETKKRDLNTGDIAGIKALYK